MSEKATHISLNYPSQDSEILFRASDGIAIGQRKRTVVLHGEDPNKKTSRVFIDGDHAKRYLREAVPLLDLVQTHGNDGVYKTRVVIEDRDGEGSVILPDNYIDLPGTGPRKFN